MVCEEMKILGFSGSQVTHPPELGLWAKQPSALRLWHINHQAETAEHAGCWGSPVFPSAKQQAAASNYSLPSAGDLGCVFTDGLSKRVFCVTSREIAFVYC